MRPGEPSGPIQLIPPGLLGLLQIKSPAGQNPNVLNADVQPIIDIEPYWLRANRIIDNVNRGVTLAAGTYFFYQPYSPNAIVVPEKEWWYVHSYSITGVLLNAGDAMTNTRLAMSFNQVGTQRYSFLGNESAGVDGAFIPAYGSFCLMAEKFWLPPGSGLGFWTHNVSGPGGLQVDVRGLDYTVLPI